MTLPGLAELLLQQKERIVARFVAEVQRKDLSPPGVSRSLLVDHIPRFLDEIIREVADQPALRMSQDAVDTSATARQHGEQRWLLGYDLDALIREYGVLRHCIVQTAKEVGAHLSIDEVDVLAKCLSVGVAQAATAYARHRDEQLAAEKASLEFLAEAGQLLSSSLDTRSTLTRLTGLLVPRLADWCAIHLEGGPDDLMPLAHADPTKVELLRELYRDHGLPADATRGYPHVMRTGQPELVAQASPEVLAAATQSPEQRALLSAVGASSWMVVPLVVQGHTFGALTLACGERGRRYAEHDLVLAGEIARRAAVALDNARLYELSQKERSRVEAATRAKDEFVAVVSHELRTPLNAMLGWLRLIRSGSLPEAKKQHALDVIERNARAQSQLVADLLDISRVITGKIRINPAQIDMANVLDMAIEGIRPAAEAKSIRLELDVDRAAGVMRGDADRLQQVAWNLLTNAVKFTPKNGVVTVRLRRVESDLELSVEDTGVGVPPSFLPFVFDSFRQADSGASRAHGGLGIGLSIAKHIVELHGGSVDATSGGVDKGAAFRVRLPIGPLVSTTFGVSRVPAATLPAAALGLPAGLEGLRVLVVDDEADARELVTYLLESCGMEVRAAASAAEAMATLETFEPQVIVSDIGMPNEDGYSLIRTLRTTAPVGQRDIPAIALTAFARNEDRTRALVEGFNLHMTKPVEPAAIVSAVVELATHAKR